MLHPYTEVRFVDPSIGYGVFATRPIPKGTVVWVRDQLDRGFTEDEVRTLEPALQQVLEQYCFRDREGSWVLCWDNTRFINHSFLPNCILTPYGFDLTVADIPADAQLTNDYGFFNIIEPLQCLPEPGNTRACVMPDDLLRYADYWDELLIDAFPLVNQVEQPLMELIPLATREELQRIIRGEIRPESIRSCYFNRPSQNSGL